MSSGGGVSFFGRIPRRSFVSISMYRWTRSSRYSFMYISPVSFLRAHNLEEVLYSH